MHVAASIAAEHPFDAEAAEHAEERREKDSARRPLRPSGRLLSAASAALLCGLRVWPAGLKKADRIRQRTSRRNRKAVPRQIQARQLRELREWRQAVDAVE